MYFNKKKSLNRSRNNDNYYLNDINHINSNSKYDEKVTLYQQIIVNINILEEQYEINEIKVDEFKNNDNNINIKQKIQKMNEIISRKSIEFRKPENSMKKVLNFQILIKSYKNGKYQK